MADEVTEKQHQATAKRLQDLRGRGQVLRSKDLTSGLVFIVIIMLLLYLASGIKTRIEDNFIIAFTSMRQMAVAREFPGAFVTKMVVDNFLMLTPLFLGAILTALLSPFLFGGWNFTLKPVSFKLESLNALNNLQNIFSKRMLTNILKSLLKVSLIIAVLVIFLYFKKSEINMLINLPVRRSIENIYSISREFVIIMACSLAFIILFDVLLAYFEFIKKAKMTSQEVKDEYKEAEGSPEMKRKVRSAQLAIIRQRLSITVPRATVIVTNPTHYAIAIRYEEGKDKAPKVLAKGKDYVATQIRKLGIANSVPIYQAPELARAIYHTTKVNAEISPGLYMAVAIVLSYVRQLKNYQQGLAQQPQYISDLKIPEEFVFDE